jgi:MinD-like ATPase involved in chromosome partitioning or flagellar assembly
VNKNVIAFWSTVHGQTGNTSNLLAAAVTLSLNYNLKVLIMHNQLEKSSMESAFLNLNNQDAEFDEMGIDALIKLTKAGRLQPGLIKSYSHNISNRLDMLIGSSQVKQEMFEDNICETIATIIENARESYDLVLVDLNSGELKESSNKILELADIVVVSLNQNNVVLKSYFDNDALKSKEKVIVLGNYIAESKYSINHIKKLYNCKEKIYAIPSNIDFKDSHNDNRLYDFFILNNNIDRYDDNYEFIRNVKELAQELVDKAQVEYVETPVVKKKGIFTRFISTK